MPGHPESEEAAAMGLRLIVGHEQGEDPTRAMNRAVLFDSVSGQAFGPVFEEVEGESAEDRAERFLSWIMDTQGIALGDVTPADVIVLYERWTHQEVVAGRI